MVDDQKQGGEEVQHPPFVAKGPFAQREEVVLDAWNKEDIFNKTLQKPAPKGDFVFYDGPPFATGLPHYGHLLQSALKDAVPRYRTMQGYRVARRWGWDCHGLPLENIIEAQLGIKTKRDIEQMGVGKFNEAARGAVLQYADEWKRIIPRFGRFVDMENDYRTMDASYTQSVWWAFKQLHNRGLVYEGYKAMQLCPRCGTTLSNFEVAQGYQDINDITATVKFALVDEPGTFLLAWTTTPWTLPGNTALAVNAQATYVKVKIGNEFVVVSQEYFAKIGDGEVVGTIKGKELVGKKYTPPFSYFVNEVHKHKTHAWRVYAAEFVTVDSGTGIVHIAPAFGADDLALAQKEKVPVVHHVTEEGKFTAAVTDFAGLPVKPKGRHMETDIKIVAWLQEKGLLFNQEKIKHSYPHCWRCDTPLINWASNSWFVNVQKIKPKLLRENARIKWVPEHVGSGRFMKLLESAPDWAISRTRYWGAPLPVWRHSKTKEIQVAGSVDDLLRLVRRSGNNYFIMRHGQSDHNVAGCVHDDDTRPSHLTDVGRQEARAAADMLKDKKIDYIVVSPLVRAQETAQIVRSAIGLAESSVMTDERLRETGVGIFNGKTMEEWKGYFSSRAARFETAPPQGESYADIRRRVGEFLFDIEQRYTGKNILIVSHGDPLWLMYEVAARTSTEVLRAQEQKTMYLNTAECRELSFVPYPHNANFELDLHRPYIDEIPMGNVLEGRWERVPDVFDCWFESGSMPFASNGYPTNKQHFDPKRWFGFAPKGYPADFIAESIDQTRGWFYSMLVLSTALFGKSAYKAVVTNGLILAEDGRKMSKKLKNYPDPMEVVEKYGADSLRYYLLSSAVIRGEDLRFSERGVDEVSKKLLMRLDNVRSFYEMYAGGQPMLSEETLVASSHVLDQWILSRLAQLVRDATLGYETYQLDAATRPLLGFVDDLSNWYVRRSRDRFKTDGADKQAALTTLREVLFVVSHVMAPVMPFYADDLYKRVMHSDGPASVHLSDWPTAAAPDDTLVADMALVRDTSSRALQLREKAGIKIRQPLARLSVKTLPSNTALHALIADEANVKAVTQDATIADDVVLDTTLTPELRDEGLVRDLVRMVQDLRKKEGLTIGDRPQLTVATNAEGKTFINKHTAQLSKETGLRAVHTEEGGSAVKDFEYPVDLSLQL